MAGREPTPDELAAASIVAGQLKGEANSRDGIGAPEGTHDFDVELTDGTRVALEVTAAIDTAVVSLQNAAFGRAWPAPELGSDWWIGIPQENTEIKLRDIRRTLAAQLRDLEACGAAERLPQSPWNFGDDDPRVIVT